MFRISKRYSTIGSNPLIPSKFRVQDPKLLTEISVKNRQLTPSEEARVHGLQRIAMDAAGYSKAPTTAKRAFWTFWASSSIVFLSVLYNVVENYWNELELYKIGEKAAKDFVEEIIDKEYDYSELKAIFVGKSKENIMTFALGKAILMKSKENEELKFKIVAARNFLHFLTNDFKVEDVKVGSSLSAYTKGAFAMENFVEYFERFPLLSLYTLHLLKNIPNGSSISQRKLFVYLISRRSEIPLEVRQELILILRAYPGLQEFIHDEKVAADEAYKIALLSETDNYQKRNTETVRDFLKDLSS